VNSSLAVHVGSLAAVDQLGRWRSAEFFQGGALGGAWFIVEVLAGGRYSAALAAGDGLLQHGPCLQLLGAFFWVAEQPLSASRGQEMGGDGILAAGARRTFAEHCPWLALGTAAPAPGTVTNAGETNQMSL